MSGAAAVKRHLLPLGVAIAALVIAAGGDALGTLTRYDRLAIGQGELWRLFTGNFAHLGWPHLAMNLAGLALVWLLFGSLYSAARWAWIIAASALGTGLCLYFADPEVIWYVGLSGALHGLFAAGGLADLTVRPREAAVFLAAVTAKLAWEQYAGPLPGSEETAGGPVLVQAHLYGAVSGVAAVVVLNAKKIKKISRGETRKKPDVKSNTERK